MKRQLNLIGMINTLNVNILDQIIEYKRTEVEEQKFHFPMALLEHSSNFPRPVVSLKSALLKAGSAGIIAEIKRKSPSKGVINADVSIEHTSVGYVEAGASALSILTDRKFFGGSNEDLLAARKLNVCPILRKEFVIDPYQIIEAKSIGADAILLIAAVLSPKDIVGFTQLAHSLGLEVLLEVHNESELNANITANVDVIGVNNRDLKTFTLSIETSKRLASLIPSDVIKISESGIDSIEAIVELKGYGFKGFLMGQTFMQNSRPEQAAMKFMEELKTVKSGGQKN
jgi:indole-3-glycerol phosphate synthase